MRKFPDLIKENSSYVLELCFFGNLGILTCQQYISKTVCARGLKLGQLIGDDEKIC